MKRLISVLLLIFMVLPFVVACGDNPEENEPIILNQGDFVVKFGKNEFSATVLNSTPENDAVAVYTRDYKIDGKYSFVVGKAQEGRTAFSIRCILNNGVYEYDIAEKTEDVASAPIPVNGFVITIPSASLEGVRANKGQLVDVVGAEKVLGEYERMDCASIAPDYLVSTASRRVNMSNPINDFVENKIYYIDDAFKGTKSLSIDNVVVTTEVATNYSVNIVSIAKMNEISAPEKGKSYFVFTGEYNIAYANYYFANAERISFSMLEKSNPYSDTSAIILGESVIELNEKNHNVESVSEDGIFFFDNDYSAAVTPAIDKKRMDVIVVDGMVAHYSEENTRTLIPDGNGFVITLVGDENIGRKDDFKLGMLLNTCFIEYEKLPEKYVLINDNAFGIDLIDGARVPEGVSVLYTPAFGSSTQTNEFGVEITIVDNKITKISRGAGNSAIPENGYVLSIHKDNESYSKARNIEEGDDIELVLAGSSYSVSELKYDGENTTRLENMLIIYKNKPSSGSNEFGFEIAIDADGYTVDASYDGNLTIPKNGYVLSGHGTQKTALENAYAIGQKVILDTSSRRVIMVKTPEQKINTAEYSIALISDRIETAKKSLLNIDYKMLDEQLTLLNTMIADAEKAFDEYDFNSAMTYAESVISTCENLRYLTIETKAVENRAVWHRSAEQSDDEVRATVAKLKALNVNAVYLETWYEGYCIGAKVNMPGITTPAVNGTYDALDGFVRICHENGIEVHSWVHNFFVGFYYENGAKYYNPYFDDFKDKYLIDIKGRDYFYYSANNNNFIFLNSNDRECRDLILELYRQLITNYDIDGLHLDYVRYPELNYGTDDFGYNKDIIDAFAKKTGITKDPHTFVKGTAEMEAWIQFRCDIITSFVGEVHDMVREIKPELWLSAATYPDIILSKNTIVQDVCAFVDNGYLDEVFSMSYGVNNETVLTSVNDYVKITNGKSFYTAGIAAFLETTPNNFADQLTAVELAGADGVSVFALSSINPNTYQLQMTEGAFRTPSIQVYKLSESVSAQMQYIKDKCDNVEYIWDDPNGDIQFIKACADEIKNHADEFDLENATIEQKIEYCNQAKQMLDRTVEHIITMCGDYSEVKTMLAEFEDMSYWLTITAKRLETRK